MHPGTAEDPQTAVEGAGPGLLARALQLLALWGVAVANPLFGQLSANAEFFVAHGSRPVEIVALALMLCLLAPALMALIEGLTDRLAPWAGRATHQLLVALLAAAIALQPLNKLAFFPVALQILAALAFGAIVAMGYERLVVATSILALAPLVYAAIFLFASPVSQLLGGASPAGTTLEADRPGQATAQRPPVVLVVFDELSLPMLMDGTHRIDALRYPAFAALEAGSHWFRNATATSDNTVLSVPTLLTGRYLAKGFRKNPVPIAVNYPDNLFTLLAGDYRLNVSERVTALCPSELCAPAEAALAPAARMRILTRDLALLYLHLLLPARLANALPPVDQQWGRFTHSVDDRVEASGPPESATAPPTSGRRLAIPGKPSALAGDEAWSRQPDGAKVRSISSFLASVRADPGREGAEALHFLHSGLPHVPWRYLPSGNHYGTQESGLIQPGPGLAKGFWVEDPWPVLQAFQRYLLQQAFVDRLLGDLLQTLKEVGLYDRALLIVTADHGVSFQPGKHRRHVDRQSFADVMSVPLFIKLPEQRQGVFSDRNVELVDVLPTIVEVLSLEAPWTMDGTSVFDTTVPERAEKRLLRGRSPRNRMTFDNAAMDAKYATVARMVETFGPSADPLALYRIGPNDDLLGRPLSELDIADEARYEVELKQPENFDHVDPASGFVPTRVIGHVRSDALGQEPLALAIAVGGVVWATTHTLKAEASRAQLTAMVPERAFAAGRNLVEVFTISGTPVEPRLIPTRSGR